ncbi:hypothetical protein H5410_043227 [Solanum commersonii]|uniref:Uncharacterized protein n=1 Tax=Solanum commersonii TaxID=4109 RepID=A0A9J5XWZ1_SOLCO|nr:hypothetical protein H5410_043227 [Solanum commersonii]
MDSGDGSISRWLCRNCKRPITKLGNTTCECGCETWVDDRTHEKWPFVVDIPLGIPLLTVEGENNKGPSLLSDDEESEEDYKVVENIGEDGRKRRMTEPSRGDKRRKFISGTYEEISDNSEEEEEEVETEPDVANVVGEEEEELEEDEEDEENDPDITEEEDDELVESDHDVVNAADEEEVETESDIVNVAEEEESDHNVVIVMEKDEEEVENDPDVVNVAEEEKEVETKLDVVNVAEENGDNEDEESDLDVVIIKEKAGLLC